MARKNNPKTQWVDQFHELPNQSNFHETVRTILRTDPWFKNLRCYQEVPVIDLVPDYSSSQHRFDWYIEELATVLELHGEQHYKATAFGAMSYEEKNRAFADGQMRDQLKREAAEDHDFKYRAISYKEISKLTGPYLKTLLLQR